MTHQHIFNNNNMTGVTSRAGSAYLSGASALTPGFLWVCVAQSLVFCLIFGVSLFVFLAIALPVL